MSKAFTPFSGTSLFDPSLLPASFVYGGEPSNALLAAWPNQEMEPVELVDRTVYELAWQEPDGGLVATWHVEVFHHWPAVEFRWLFSNKGAGKTKPLTKVEALDLKAPLKGRDVAVHHSLGGLSDDTGFTVTRSAMNRSNPTMVLSGNEGRSSDRNLPFFVLHARNPDEGLFVGVGWSGQWQANIKFEEGELDLRVEMPGTNLAIPPGSRIISPSILLGTATGPWTAGANLLRRLLYAGYIPLLNGAKPLPPVSWSSWFQLFNGISEEILMAQADGAAAAGVEYFCIDAGWFEGGFQAGVGNWTLDKEKFPRGLGPISEAVAKKGMKLGLWFEPERAVEKTRLAREHPEWMLGDVVDLGNQAARDWIFDMMKGFIDEADVQWIRYDFNTEPLSRWNEADAPDEQGLTQIRHIMGLYDLLDRIMTAFPNLLIESCASGGRRIDLETIRRAHTFWKSDNASDLKVLRFHQTGGNVFLPAQLLNANLTKDNIVSNVTSLFGGPLGFQCLWTQLDLEVIRELGKKIALYKELRPLLNEEYYSLFCQYTFDEPGWIGWQFHSPTSGEGFIIALRPETAPYPIAEYSLQGLEDDATYQLVPADGTPGEARTLTGMQLSKAASMELKPGTSALYRYHRVK